MHAQKLLLLPAMTIGIFLLSDCSPKVGKSTATTMAPAPKPETRATDAQVAQGQTIYMSNCGKCHKLIRPMDKSLDKWNSVLPSMIHKAKLSDADGALVRAYVMANLK